MMRYFYGNLIFIVTSVIFFTIYFTRFLDLQNPTSSATESNNMRELVQSQNEAITLTTERNKELEFERKLHTDIFFLKTHKCGSSTVQNIIMRFGLRNGLDFVLPEKNNYLGNPKYFTESMIGKSVQTLNKVYNVFTHHTRFNETSVRKVMGKNALYVTILRKPAELYESLYNYYNLEKRYQMNLTTFIENSSAMEKTSRSGSKFGFNQMCFDLGLNEKHFESRRKIKQFILRISQTFHLVMMTEYMEESLILLADLMKWDLKDIVFIKLKERSNTTRKTELTVNQRKILRKLNDCDTKLQNHFFKKFKQQIQNYGVDKMKAKLQELVRLNDEFYRNCVEKVEYNTSLTVKYKIKSTSDFTCSYATTSELSFTSLLQNVQRKRVSKLRSLKRLMNNEHLFQN